MFPLRLRHLSVATRDKRKKDFAVKYGEVPHVMNNSNSDEVRCKSVHSSQFPLPALLAYSCAVPMPSAA